MKMKKIMTFLILVIAICWFAFTYEIGRNRGWRGGFNRAWADYEKGFADGRRSKHDYKKELDWGQKEGTIDVNSEGITIKELPRISIDQRFEFDDTNEQVIIIEQDTGGHS